MGQAVPEKTFKDLVILYLYIAQGQGHLDWVGGGGGGGEGGEGGIGPCHKKFKGQPMISI